jgi:hypothetical protein
MSPGQSLSAVERDGIDIAVVNFRAGTVATEDISRRAASSGGHHPSKVLALFQICGCKTAARLRLSCSTRNERKKACI